MHSKIPQQRSSDKGDGHMNQDIQQPSHEAQGKGRWIGIAIAVFMIALGVCFLSGVLIDGVFHVYSAAIGILVYGCFNLATFLGTPQQFRNGWKLSNGVILVVIGILIFVSSLSGISMIFAFLLGFSTMLLGANRIYSSFKLSKMGDKAFIWVLASGLINLCLSAFFIVAPMTSLTMIDYIFGVYLLVAGSSLIVEIYSGQIGKWL